MASFAIAIRIGAGITPAILGAFVLAALCNYILCIAILFQHKSRWNTGGEIILYAVSVCIMGLLDYGVTKSLMGFAWHPVWAKFWASMLGFVGNFLLRRWLVFPERKSHA
jgi:putative flippase GtrA